jgi:hypothetical protein
MGIGGSDVPNNFGLNPKVESVVLCALHMLRFGHDSHVAKVMRFILLGCEINMRCLDPDFGPAHGLNLFMHSRLHRDKGSRYDNLHRGVCSCAYGC